MKQFLFFKTKWNRNGGAYFLVVNLEKKVFCLSTDGSWNNHVVVNSKKTLINITIQLKDCGFEEVESRGECGY